MMRIRAEEGLKESSLALEFNQKSEVFPGVQKGNPHGECEFTAPSAVRLKAARIGEMVEVKGNLETTLRLTCGRCLTEFVGPLATDFAITYVRRCTACPPTARRQKSGSRPRTLASSAFGDEIDLTEGIQEQVVLCLPLRPLCREDCKGLCAACGADLNVGECNCRRQHPTGPFAALRHLRLGKD